MLGKKRYFFLIALLLALSVPVYWRAINPGKFGFYHDDGIYLVTAKALATGQGYKILSLPGEPWQTKYPPVFPLALSALWRAYPDFPSNLCLFSAFSICCTLVSLALTAAYLLKRSYASPIQILLLLLFTFLNWRTIILATSVLTEAFFAALAVCVLWLASSRGEKRSAIKSLALGVFLALAALTRLAGISLLAAVIIFAFKQKQIRKLLPPIVLASSMIAGWFWWCHLHQAAAAGSHAAYYTNYFQDWQSLLQSNEPGAQRSLLGPFAAMVGRNALALLATIPVVCLGIQIDWLRNMAEAWRFLVILIGFFSIILLIIGFWKTRLVGKGLLHFYILAYLALHLLWPYMIYDRFLIPVLPFVLFFIVSGGTHLLHACLEGRQAHGWSARVAGLIFSCTILMPLSAAAVLGLALGISDQLRDSKMAYTAIAQEKQELIAWLKTKSGADDILICYQDPVYFLYADRKAIRLPAPSENESFESYADRLQGFIKDNKVKLLLRTEDDFSLESHSVSRRNVFADALNCRPSVYIPVFTTSSRKSAVYRISPGTVSEK
jgi:hypothetical protein